MRTCRCPCAQLAAKSGKVDVLSRRATRRATRSRHGTRRLEAGICPRLLRCVPESHSCKGPNSNRSCPSPAKSFLPALSGGSFSLLYQMILFSGSGETSVLCLNLFFRGPASFSEVKSRLFRLLEATASESITQAALLQQAAAIVAPRPDCRSALRCCQEHLW